MQKFIVPEILGIEEEINCEPKLSIIIPFDPKMKSRKVIAHSLEVIISNVEQQLIDYTKADNQIIMKKLRAIIKDLNFNTHKNSIAIFISPVFEKILYLNFNVNQKITVGAFLRNTRPHI